LRFLLLLLPLQQLFLLLLLWCLLRRVETWRLSSSRAARS
jgi:hypothetical protein